MNETIEELKAETQRTGEAYFKGSMSGSFERCSENTFHDFDEEYEIGFIVSPGYIETYPDRPRRCQPDITPEMEELAASVKDELDAVTQARSNKDNAVREVVRQISIKAKQLIKDYPTAGMLYDKLLTYVPKEEHLTIKHDRYDGTSINFSAYYLLKNCSKNISAKDQDTKTAFAAMIVQIENPKLVLEHGYGSMFH